MNFQIETTSICSLTCSYCPNKDMIRKREFMTMDVWKTIIDEYVVPYRHINAFCPPTLIPHKDGEPLLNKQQIEMLRYASDRVPDMNIDTYSHGLMLPKWRERGQDFIAFLGSLPNKCRYLMSFHPFNHDGSSNEYAHTILYLQEVLRDPPRNVEFITVSHKSKWVSEQMQAWWKEQWKGLPITVHNNCAINPWTGRIEEATCAYNGCPYSDFGHWFFGVTGNIIACCLDLEEEIILGNVMRDDPAEMFERTSAFYMEQRRILEAKELHPRGVCRNCYGQQRDDVPAALIPLGVPA